MMKNSLKPVGNPIGGQAAVLIDTAQQSRAAQRDSSLIVQAIAGVLRHAQDGDLPLFAWTLGLPRDAWLTMIGAHFPELDALEPMSSKAYAAIEQKTPRVFLDLAAMLFEHRSAAVDDVHADWLARTLAAGCLGSRHLWQDLGLSGREDVSALMTTFFPALCCKNTRSLKWKRFLFAELVAQRGYPEIPLPNCSRCDDFTICFPVVS